jgi:class 3 adenylate cyclase
MEIPETRFARLGDAKIAYQVVGEGSIDLVFMFGFSTNVDTRWHVPALARPIQRLASFARVILFDRRGSGASDPVPLDALPTWEIWADDLRAVLDAAGSERAAIIAGLDGGSMGMLFAAAHPERVSALVLANTAARYVEAEGYPEGHAPDVAAAIERVYEETWGSEDLARMLLPSRADDPAMLRAYAFYQRTAVRPAEAAAYLRYLLALDVRSALPSIQAPTLVINRKSLRVATEAQARYVAEHISGAKLVIVPGADGLFLADGADEKIYDLIEEFFTGARRWVDPDRVLATIMFTDMVGSTNRAASLGDRRWKELLDTHNEIVRRRIDDFRGRLIGIVGDGAVATFDGPARAIRCAAEVHRSLRTIGIDIRSGLHAGEVEVGGGAIGGLAMHIASRVQSHAESGEVLVSSTVKDLVTGSGIEFSDRGERDLKGVPGRWHLYAVMN